ncbi:MAG: prepilin peptidase [Aerococcus sp.]|nr:prepilin peptidase [Aerococcus sp.]
MFRLNEGIILMSQPHTSLALIWQGSYWVTLVFLFSCLSSFLTVVGGRLVSGRSWMRGRSTCDHCQSTIPWYALIPVFGYFMTHCHCPYCQHKISFYYPFSEGLVTISSLLLWREDPSFPLSLAIFAVLVTMAGADHTAQWIPDRLQLVLFLFIFLNSCQHPHFPWMERLSATLFIGGLLLLLVYCMKSGIGGADIKVLLLLTWGYGLQGVSLLLLLATSATLVVILIQSLTRHPSIDQGVPFIPFLAFSYPMMVLLLR